MLREHLFIADGAPARANQMQHRVFPFAFSRRNGKAQTLTPTWHTHTRLGQLLSPQDQKERSVSSKPHTGYQAAAADPCGKCWAPAWPANLETTGKQAGLTGVSERLWKIHIMKKLRVGFS